ncbi:hypothetical protein K1719_024963 [Acacia pycnantha]|nr:hypothetical protein K1719_024963 [Acacia pycnantha]
MSSAGNRNVVNASVVNGETNIEQTVKTDQEVWHVVQKQNRWRKKGSKDKESEKLQSENSGSHFGVLADGVQDNCDDLPNGGSKAEVTVGQNGGVVVVEPRSGIRLRFAGF